MTAPTKHTRRTVLAGIAAGGALATTATTAIAAVLTADPAVELSRRWLATEGYGNRCSMTDDERDAFSRDVLQPIEKAMLETEPTTAAGALAMAAVAIDLDLDQYGEPDKDAPYYDWFVFNILGKVRDAARRGIA